MLEMGSRSGVGMLQHDRDGVTVWCWDAATCQRWGHCLVLGCCNMIEMGSRSGVGMLQHDRDGVTVWCWDAAT